MGDLDGDGVPELVIGVPGDDTGGGDRGAINIVFLNANGTVKSSTKIASGTNGGPSLANVDRFGSSVSGVGDLNGDGVPDLAVGARGDDTGGDDLGAVYLLFMNSDGTVKSFTKLAHALNGIPGLANRNFSGSLAFNSYFGSAVASLGDVDGDGVSDLAVGAAFESSGLRQSGSAYVVFMDTDGTAKKVTEIAHALNGGPTLAIDDHFGSSLSGIGDVDGDGVADLAVGSGFVDSGGAVFVLLLNVDGSVKGVTKIGSGLNGGPSLVSGDFFGVSVANIGDRNQDGVSDLAVGASFDDTGGNSRGAVHVLFMNSFPESVDYGDAPDTGIGTSMRNYQTRMADNGPAHAVIAALFLGNTVDGDDGTLQNAAANADDVNGTLADDEDGVLNPLDLLGTIGAAPTVTLLVTNRTGSTATLAGWIDYDRDGVFESSERATVAVATGTSGERMTLTFPTIPTDSD